MVVDFLIGEEFVVLEVFNFIFCCKVFFNLLRMVVSVVFLVFFGFSDVNSILNVCLCYINCIDEEYVVIE